jgi:hypothetical protein
MNDDSKILRVRMQGNLDGLCGIYSIVNAAQNLSKNKLSEKNTNDLFRVLCRALSADQKLEDALFEGISVKPLGKLIDVASKFLSDKRGFSIDRHRAFKSKPDGLDKMWNKISDHVDKHGPGSVILGLGKTHDHWTCVREIKNKQISLIDSDGLRRLSRKHCTISESPGKRLHILWPTQTYLLSANRNSD